MSSSRSSLSAISMIRVKRYNTRPHTDEELRWWIESYVNGDIPDYQMSAWLMAVCFSGMTQDETSLLTRHMVQSGQVLQWPSSSPSNTKVAAILADKHSTGGVGDKISLVLAPLVVTASRGAVAVPMMSGRGLDHTGGTLDKLESIPGYRVHLSVSDFQDVVMNKVGCSIVSAGNNDGMMMVPADRKLYALRDVTGTVACFPLQTASIVSKKIAEAPHTLVLDVKHGRAAFQSSVEGAMELSRSMIATAEANGVVPTTAFITRMDHPIGYAIGNWLEVKECVDLLKTGVGATDLIQLVVVEAAQMLLQSGTFPNDNFESLVEVVYATLKEGKAYAKFRDMVEAHGGDVSVLDDPESYPDAKYKKTILAPQDGYVSDMDALEMGRASVDLGAGRRVADEPVDPNAGILLKRRVGEAVQSGDEVAVVYTSHSEELLGEMARRVEDAIRYSNEIVSVPPVVTHRVDASSGAQNFQMPLVLTQI